MSETSNAPKDLKYTESHEWLKVIDETTARIGITDHAQNELSDVIFYEAPEIGDSFQQGDEIAVLESVKAASDIYTPVSGEVTASNQEVVSDPSLVNSSPYDKAWLFEIKITAPEEVKKLLSAEDYLNLIKNK